MNNSTRNHEQRIRRALRKHDHALWKVREGPEYWQYGPYAIIDTRINFIVEHGLELDDIDDRLADAT